MTSSTVSRNLCHERRGGRAAQQEVVRLLTLDPASLIRQAWRGAFCPPPPAFGVTPGFPQNAASLESEGEALPGRLSQRFRESLDQGRQGCSGGSERALRAHRRAPRRNRGQAQGVEQDPGKLESTRRECRGDREDSCQRLHGAIRRSYRAEKAEKEASGWRRRGGRRGTRPGRRSAN